MGGRRTLPDGTRQARTPLLFMRLRYSTPLAALLLVPQASAQVPEVLLRVGETIDVGGSAQTVFELGATTANSVSGRAVSVGTFGPLGLVDLVLGSTRGGDDGVLQAEGEFGNYRQVDYDARIGLSAFAPAYAASCQSLVSLQTGLRVAWHGPIPSAGTPNFAPAAIGGFWRQMDEVGTRANGLTWFRAALSDAPGGSISRRGFFAQLPGGNIEALVLAGESYPGMPAAIAGGGARSGASMSALGAHWIAPVFLALSSGMDSAMMLDGAALEVGGEVVQENALVSASAGGMGERWDEFHGAGIDDQGRWFFYGESSGLGANGQFICRDGAIWLREGGLLAGQLLSGPIRGAALNPAGELAFLWSVANLPSPPLQGVYREMQALAFAGDAVDLDGDGVLDPGATIVSFREGSVSISAGGDVFVIATLQNGAGPFDAWLRLPREVGERSCSAVPNVSGVPASVTALGSDLLADNSLALRCTGMPRFAFGFFLTSQQLGFAASPGGAAGNLCLGGSIGRFQMQVQSSGAAGVVQIDVDLTALPQPNGLVGGLVGETWSFSTWFRDVGPAGVTSNFSDAVSVTLR